jgi:hypothetical protein
MKRFMDLQYSEIKTGWLPFLALLLILALVKTASAAPKGYRIQVKLKNSSDTCILLAHYYGNKQYLDDTAYLSRQGVFEFTGTEKLPEGMYIIAGQSKNRYFDFFLTGSQQMEFECNPSDVTKTMKVKGSEENQKFYDYIRFLGEKQSEIEPFNKWKQTHKERNDSTAIIQEKIERIDREAKSFIRNFYSSNPDYLAAKFVRANNEPDILPYITDAAGKVDSSIIFRVYKDHYFDNFDFGDPRLIYSPVFTSKIDNYLDKICLPVLDSLQADIDWLLSLSSANTETQKYLAWYLSLKYESSDIMGHDALFVYLVRKHLEQGKVEWMYPSVKDNILKRINTIEPLLLGKPAPNLILLDTSNYARALSTVQAKYTLVFFWESTCGH